MKGRILKRHRWQRYPMRNKILIIFVVSTLFGGNSLCGQTAKKDNLPRIPGATLLVGAPYDLTLTNGDTTIHLQPEDGSRYGRRLPSISSNGRIVAFTHALPGPPLRFVPSTLAMDDKTGKWTDQEIIGFGGGATAISPDGSKLVCARHNGAASWNLQILDLRTGAISVGPQLGADPGQQISWSPDGRRIAFEMLPQDSPTTSMIYTIYILDLETFAVKPVSIGHSPSWSPSGEWIAYVAYVPRKDGQSPQWCHAGQCYEPDDSVSLMTPDGTQSRTLMTYRSYLYGAPPVWSPDSKTLLINKSRNAEIDSYDIYLLDIATGKRTRKFKNTKSVSVWVEAH